MNSLINTPDNPRIYDEQNEYEKGLKLSFTERKKKLAASFYLDQIKITNALSMIKRDNTLLDNKAYASLLIKILTSETEEYNSIIDIVLSKIDKGYMQSIGFRGDSPAMISPMDVALMNRDEYLVKKLLPYDLQVKRDNFLLSIVYFKDEELIKILLEKYLDNDTKILNERPLLYAAKKNSLPVVRVLVNMPNILYSQRDKYGNTCLHWASINASSTSGEKKRVAFEIIKLLLDKYPTLADIENHHQDKPWDTYQVTTAPNVRKYIKTRASGFFRKNPNTEKNRRDPKAKVIFRNNKTVTYAGGRLKRKTLKRR